MKEISYNYVLTAAVISWCAAQVIKTVLNFIQTKKFHAERLFGAGGMPSSHSALVCSATVAMCRECGVGSPEFALMFIVAMVVMYDAMGVRRSAGLHAREINRINRIFADEGIKTEDESGKSAKDKKKKELKEYLGHTPFEVLGGALLGILISMIVPMTLK
ncbi:MAG: divergent PAP2 family protein [Ruminococcus sp.]|nr:divergent PAP2 family protein [Ruminococcus sp.]MCM1381743.1 divergent PAP2 family protein [Muribaculaceae bacterium]MCM1478128.1 divergent PAP2 family protein [Muribaculaceae bacterium]